MLARTLSKETPPSLFLRCIIGEPLMAAVMVGSPVVAAFLPIAGEVRIRLAWSHYVGGLVLAVGLIVGLVIGGFFGT